MCPPHVCEQAEHQWLDQEIQHGLRACWDTSTESQSVVHWMMTMSLDVTHSKGRTLTKSLDRNLMCVGVCASRGGNEPAARARTGRRLVADSRTRTWIWTWKCILQRDRLR